MRENIHIIEGDFLNAVVDALVVPINTDLILGSEGLSAQIKKRGGSEIQSELNEIGRVEMGTAVITGVGKLKTKILIHTACIPSSRREELTEETMILAVRNALARARDEAIKTVALPPLGTQGAAGFPLKRSAELLLSEAIKHLEGDTTIEEITFYLPDRRSFHIFEECMRQI